MFMTGGAHHTSSSFFYPENANQPPPSGPGHPRQPPHLQSRLLETQQVRPLKHTVKAARQLTSSLANFFF